MLSPSSISSIATLCTKKKAAHGDAAKSASSLGALLIPEAVDPGNISNDIETGRPLTAQAGG
jgi:hypothetical protein